jgi:hypothetical protein
VSVSRVQLLKELLHELEELFAMPISRAQILKELLPGLEKLFGAQYAETKNGTEYHMRSRYGKYSIYKWEYVNGNRTSSTLVKGVNRDEAIGMMKLLKEPK